MGGSASERNRELLAKSAALLAADYPLDVLIERLCNAIASALHATVYVALPDTGETVRIAYLTQRGTRRHTDGAPMPSGSRVERVFATGRTVSMRERSDWAGEPECAFVFSDGTTDTDEATSAIYAPVAYGKEILGVMTVQHPDPHAFNSDDVELIESVARYLAIALRNQRTVQITASPLRYPWYVAAIIVLIAMFASTAELYTMCARVTEVRDQSSAIRSLMLSRVAGSVKEHLRDDVVYANITEKLVAPLRGDRAEADRLLDGLVRASDHTYFFGAGVFYAPHVFDRRSSLFGPYVFSDKGRIGMRENTEAIYDYADSSWYRLGVAAHGSILFPDPYTVHGHVYVSAVKAFYDRGRLAGVISIDSLVGGLESVLRSRVSPGHRAVVANGFGTELLSSSPPLNTRDVVMVSQPLPGTTWTLRLYSDNTAVSNQKRQLGMMALGILAVIWSIAGALLAFLSTTHRERRYSANLRLQRTELQTEIATRIDAEERLRNAAYHDALTGLPNRAFFYDQLHDVLSRSEDERDLQYAVLFIDLDRFYVVNDTLGHSAGDALLRSIAQRMQEALPAHVLIARLGGDEFVLLLPSTGSVLNEASATAELILDEFRRPFFIGEREAYTGASIGIVIIDGTYADAEAVLRDADISMYQAKRSGRSRYAVFDRTLRSKISEQLELEADLRGAVERGEIVPYYQPIVRVRDASVSGFEALARWHRPQHGVVGAGEFIGIAEQAGLLRPIDAAVFERVCAEAGSLLAEVPGGRISVNVSAADLTRVNLVDDMEIALEQNGLSPASLRIEITETAVMEDAELSLKVLSELQARGFSIVVDDFGVGHSSLSYLQRLPISGVKIDRSFIMPLGMNPQALEIVRAIVVLAKTLDLFIVAEGVETGEQFAMLQTVGVDYAQGFFFSQPLPPAELIQNIGLPSSR